MYALKNTSQHVGRERLEQVRVGICFRLGLEGRSLGGINPGAGTGMQTRHLPWDDWGRMFEAERSCMGEQSRSKLGRFEKQAEG